MQDLIEQDAISVLNSAMNTKLSNMDSKGHSASMLSAL